ncbi:MAG: DUF2062 domain-containing protein [Betaproteobacteria bacterium]|nr:DUF2062 domain-containing protein [Betaproteobacteria bacterium]
MRKHFRRYLPDAAAVRANRWIAPFATWLHHPNLWHLNRDSVAGAVAIGLFSGLVPGPLQMLSALLLAVALRRNLPVALAITFYTNPFTIVPLYLVAYGYGALLIGHDSNQAQIRQFEMDWSNLYDSMGALVAWMLGLGKPLAVGLPALALTLAVLGYVAVHLAWRAYVVLAWRARARRKAKHGADRAN